MPRGKAGSSLTIKLPDSLMIWLEQEADKRSATTQECAIRAIECWLGKRPKRIEAIDGCDHPKAARRQLPYITYCEDCGTKLR